VRSGNGDEPHGHADDLLGSAIRRARLNAHEQLEHEPRERRASLHRDQRFVERLPSVHAIHQLRVLGNETGINWQPELVSSEIH
jgi:hypothetical protein